jgi:hypothetical protein
MKEPSVLEECVLETCHLFLSLKLLVSLSTMESLDLLQTQRMELTSISCSCKIRLNINLLVSTLRIQMIILKCQPSHLVISIFLKSLVDKKVPDIIRTKEQANGPSPWMTSYTVRKISKVEEEVRK